MIGELLCHKTLFRQGRRCHNQPGLAWRHPFFLNGTIFATWATRIPAVQARLALSPGELGLALLERLLGALVAMNLSGYLAARFGSQSVTTIAALSLCLMLPLLALAPTLPALVATLVLFGASNGLMDVTMNTQGVAVRAIVRPTYPQFVSRLL